MDISFQMKKYMLAKGNKNAMWANKHKQIKKMIVQYIPWAIVSCRLLQQQAFHSITQN